MLDIRKLYRPLQLRLLSLDLRTLLHLIWFAQSRFQGASELEVRNETESIGKIYYWELVLLSREALLNCAPGVRKRKLNEAGLVKLVNLVRGIEEAISRRTVSSGDDALQALHPLVHQQVRWQNMRDWDRMYRAFRIYGHSEMQPIVEKTIGLRLASARTLAMAIVGGATSSPMVSSKIDYSLVGVPAGEQRAFFKMVGSHRGKIKKILEDSRRIDTGWARSWNALESTPLVNIDADNPTDYICPLPALLLLRVTEGLFYDLVKSGEKFGKPYGHAFESYVGEVLSAQFKGPICRVAPEHPYYVGKNRKLGVDWTISDPTGHIMIECKTRRMRLSAKELGDSDDLQQSLEELSESIVQHYRNISDAKKGRTRFVNDGLPIYPFIVTYEDWRLFAPHVVNRLYRLVEDKLFPLDLIELMQSSPFTVTSIEEFEKAGQAIAQIGIAKFCAERTKLPFRHFGLGGYADHAFPDIDVTYSRLFPNSDFQMFGHLAHLFPLPSTVIA